MKNIIWIPLLLYVSCSVNDDSNDSKIEFGITWEVVEFIDAEGNKVSLVEDEVLTLRFFKEMNLGGDAACNQYGGEYLIEKDGKMIIKNLYATEIACPQPSLGDDFLHALSGVSEYETEAEKLTLHFGQVGKLIFLEKLG